MRPWPTIPQVRRRRRPRGAPDDDGGPDAGDPPGRRPPGRARRRRHMELAPGRRPPGPPGGLSPRFAPPPGPFHIGVLLANGPGVTFLASTGPPGRGVVVGINPTRRGEAPGATSGPPMPAHRDRRRRVRGTGGLDLGPTPSGSCWSTRPPTGRPVGAPRGGPKATALVHGADEVEEDQLLPLVVHLGNTGTPKAVRCTQGRLAGIAEVAAPATATPRAASAYCPMPCSHGNALIALWGPAVMVGRPSRAARFSASAFLGRCSAASRPHLQLRGQAIAYILATPSAPTTPTTPLVSASHRRPHCATGSGSRSASGAS